MFKKTMKTEIGITTANSQSVANELSKILLAITHHQH